MVGGHGHRRESDFYPTPPEATRALLPLLAGWPVNRVWEPCCGDGAIARVLEAEGFTVESSDLHNRGYGQGGVDFFETGFARGEALVTNPPFKPAAKFIQHARRIGVQRMALLLKMTFWNASTRLAIWEEWRPAAVYPLTWRLDFDGRGAPTMDCMWCLWEPMHRSESTRFEPLARPVSKTETAELLLA